MTIQRTSPLAGVSPVGEEERAGGRLRFWPQPPLRPVRDQGESGLQRPAGSLWPLQAFCVTFSRWWQSLAEAAPQARDTLLAIPERLGKGLVDICYTFRGVLRRREAAFPIPPATRSGAPDPQPRRPAETTGWSRQSSVTHLSSGGKLASRILVHLAASPREQESLLSTLGEEIRQGRHGEETLRQARGVVSRLLEIPSE
ncbi:MAG: hypothetical protein HQL56_16245 [Magnetococcales bacterium]|nr:hypothetical protein [Magnetococcales bacterium]